MDVVAKRGLNTLVTPCLSCYGRLMRKAPEGFRVTTIPDLLLEAMDGGDLNAKAARQGDCQ